MIETRETTWTPARQQLFDDLVEAHRSAFERLARRLAGSTEDAEDLLQETLIDAYRGFHGFRPDTRFYTWVARIMTNNQLDRVRRKRHPVVSLEQSGEGETDTLELPDESANPERLLLHEQLDHPYESALEALQPAHRATVTLCDLEGATYEEAARSEQCPVGTIRSRLHRAHKALREFLAQIDPRAEAAPETHRVHSRRAFLQLGTAAAAGAALAQMSAEAEAAETPRPIRVLVWAEGTAPRDVYPHDINEAIAAGLRKEDGIEVKTASITDADQGLSEAALRETDVLIWWGDQRQAEVAPERSRHVAKRVREGMGFITLHSGHRSEALKALLDSPCAWTGKAADGVQVDLAAAAPRHPIARGVSPFTIPASQAYGGAFTAAKPDVVVFDAPHGEAGRVWQGMAWTRGRGRIFYFQPGHEAYPIYFQDEVRHVIRNAVRWCAHHA